MRCPGHTSRKSRHGPPHGGEGSGLCARFAPRSAARGRVLPGRTRSRSSPEAHKSQFAPQPSERWMKSGAVCLFHFATACLRIRLPRSRRSAPLPRGTQVANCATTRCVVEKIRGCVPVSPRGWLSAIAFAQVAHAAVPARRHTSRKSRHFFAKMAQKSTCVPVGFVAFLRKKAAARLRHVSRRQSGVVCE